MTFKTAAKSFGNGLLDGAVAITTAVNNAPIENRMREIDEEIAKLQAEKTELKNKLI